MLRSTNLPIDLPLTLPEGGSQPGDYPVVYLTATGETVEVEPVVSSHHVIPMTDTGWGLSEDNRKYFSIVAGGLAFVGLVWLIKKI